MTAAVIAVSAADVARSYRDQEVRVRERPILMSGPMQRANLRERDAKTQTRRVIDPQPNNPATFGVSPIWGYGCQDGRFYIHAAFNEDGQRVDRDLACPYGQPGDRLWVRETLRRDDGWRYDADYTKALWSDRYARPSEVIEWSDRQDQRGRNVCVSIHMPRWASRTLLELTGIRAERVQSITPEDAAREGLTRCSKDGGRTWKYGIPDRDGWPGTDDDGWKWQDWCVSPVEAYANLWDSLNAKRGFGWALNPWVWVLDYRRVTEVASA